MCNANLVHFAFIFFSS